MKKKLTLALSAAALLLALGAPLLHTALARPAPAPPPSHPEYRDALNDLRNARKHLEHAARDGMGHRERAIESIDRAIEECNQALGVLR